MAKAVHVTEYGKPLVVVTGDVPVAGAGEVRREFALSSANSTCPQRRRGDPGCLTPLQIVVKMKLAPVNPADLFR